MEMTEKYASKGIAGTALGLGIGGTALALLSGNGLGGLFGGSCNEDHLVTRYEAAQSAEIAKKDSEIALLNAEINTNNKIADVFERVSGRIRTLENTVNQNVCNQAVTNQQITDNIKFVDSKFTDVYKTIREGDAQTRCYVDCHFVPGKLVMPLDSICPPAEPACPEK